MNQHELSINMTKIIDLGGRYFILREEFSLYIHSRGEMKNSFFHDFNDVLRFLQVLSFSFYLLRYLSLRIFSAEENYCLVICLIKSRFDD